MLGGAHASDRPPLLRGLRVQANVIGALIIRELHTRYGRENIGYLWMIGEPALLTGAVAALHAGHGTHFGSDVRSVPFALLGYCIFILFRGIITRAESTIDSNKPLFYHRSVTLFDMLVARALLEGAATFATYPLMLGGAVALDLASFPYRPLELATAILLMLWFSFAISMLLCAVTYENKLLTKFVHPITYLLMPASGAFFQLAWIPDPYRTWLSWFPMTQIFELARYGQFRSCDAHFVDAPFLIGSNLLLTFLGLLAIRIVRRHVHL